MLILITEIDHQTIKKSQSNHDKYFMLHYLVNNINNQYVNNYENLIVNYKFIVSKNLIDNKNKLKEYFINQYGELPNYIISFGNFDVLSSIYDKIIEYCKLVVILCDIHHGKSIKKYRLPVLLKSTYILNNYGYIYEKYYPKHHGNIFFPHSIAYTIDFNDSPIKKILISGHLNEDIYPDRQTMYKKSKINNNIYYHSPDYCGYRVSEKDYDKTYGNKYYKLLNEYLCCFTDDANDSRPYIVAKFFEIMGSGSLLLASNNRTKNEFLKLGFIDYVHYISCNMENVDEKINYILDAKNINHINEIRQNGYLLVNKKHSFKERAQQIHNLLYNNIEVSECMTSYGTSYKMIN